ncbi:RNI-like superfamily protein [Tasmannia lanceolata]|uniref:RNI-like superfamily protein n=1 Tax=Tasmannia lanceolata TaxID=3420 RepID=UPI0040627FB5
MVEKWEDLPEEIWESVFDRLKEDRYLEALSLVCKRFLSISNRIRSGLTVSDLTVRTPGGISRFFQRFHHLKRIDLVDFHGNLDHVLHEISQSGLKLEALNLSKQSQFPAASMKELGNKMKSLRTLICSEFRFLQDRDLITIALSFPFLEELDISYPEQDHGSFPSIRDWNPFPGLVTDEGIVQLSSKLPNLRKINLSGNHFLSDNSLLALSQNCFLLSELFSSDCSFISLKGISFVIRHSPNLVSLSISGSNISCAFPTSSFSSIQSLLFSCAKALCCLDLSQMFISDDFLFVIGQANLPLQKLALSSCRGYTITGILMVLRLNQSVNHLDLEGADFLTDDSMGDLIQYLPNLVSIVISSCSNLTNKTFCNLAKSCPSLEEIQMERTSLGKGDFPMPLLQNRVIKSLKLAWNKRLTDETLEGIGIVCPELRSLDVSHCWSITECGIREIGKRCCEIRELKVNGCGKVRNLGKGTEFSRLEVLWAAGSGIGDEGLSMMGGWSCSGLRRLDLEGCLRVTQRGVKEMAEKSCKGLREVNLKNCCNVGADVLAWLVFSMPSLRRIIPPSGFVPTQKQRDFFLCHGCLVLDG